MANHTRVCIVIPTHWSAQMGGSQYQAKLLIEAMSARKKYEVFYLANRFDPHFRASDHEVVGIDGPRGWRSYSFALDTRALWRQLKRLKPDCIYQRVACAYTGVAAYYATSNRRRMVWHIAGDRCLLPISARQVLKRPWRLPDEAMFRVGARNAPVVVAQSRDQQRALEFQFGRKSYLVPNFHPLPKEDVHKGGAVKVVWVANLKPVKRPELFVRLAENLSDLPQAEFVMIGSPGVDKVKHRSLLERMELINNFRYLGALPQVDVNRIIAESDVFVNTSAYEGFANTFIQAWMRKTPVISLSVNPDRVFDDERIGFLAGDYDKLVGLTRRLIGDEDLRKTMGDQAHQYALSNHCFDNVDRLIRLIDGDERADLAVGELGRMARIDNA